jgi:hypothetical protein
MSPLRNSRHEAFAQQLVLGQKTGWTQGAAYSRAGYAAEGKAADVNASRLLSNANNGIAARVQEIVGRGAKRASVTVESLLVELEDARAGATTAEQFAAATGAVIAKGKLAGLMRDRVEVGGPGSFDDCQTPEDVVARLLAEDEPGKLLAMLDNIRALVLRQAADRATLLDETPLAPRLGDEVERSLALFRPAEKGKRSR